jgi:hypothetical protein
VSVSVKWDGLKELRALLLALPAELRGEASHVVEGAANRAAADIRAAYGAHVRSGRLRNKVFVTHYVRGRFSAGAIVKAAAKHASLFEHGSQARHTAIGADRGTMPAANVFIPRVMRARAVMYDQLKALLTRKGLLVSGDA